MLDKPSRMLRMRVGRVGRSLIDKNARSRLMDWRHVVVVATRPAGRTRTTLLAYFTIGRISACRDKSTHEENNELTSRWMTCSRHEIAQSPLVRTKVGAKNICLTGTAKNRTDRWDVPTLTPSRVVRHVADYSPPAQLLLHYLTYWILWIALSCLCYLTLADVKNNANVFIYKNKTIQGIAIVFAVNVSEKYISK